MVMRQTENQKKCSPQGYGENTFPLIAMYRRSYVCASGNEGYLTVGAVYRSQELYVNATLFEDEVVPVVVVNDTYRSFFLVAFVAVPAVLT